MNAPDVAGRPESPCDTLSVGFIAMARAVVRRVTWYGRFPGDELTPRISHTSTPAFRNPSRPVWVPLQARRSTAVSPRVSPMIYDLAQPHYNSAPQFPGQPPNSILYQQLAVVEGATVERCELMTHSGSHVDAPFHYRPELPCISELPLSHFYGPCVALDLRPIEAGHPIDRDDLARHEAAIAEGIFLLLKTGWGDRRANTREFLTDWPYMSGDGARYLVERGIKGFGIDVLSTGGYPGKHPEADAHLELLGHQKLLLEDIHIPDALLDGRRRYFAALPILIANAGGSWVRPIVWDKGDLEGDAPAPEQRADLPASVAGLIALERGSR